MKRLPQYLVGRQVTIISSNQGALQPRHQSGQTSIEEIYEIASALRKGGNSISMTWIPSQESFELSRRAKEAARQATEPDRIPEGPCTQAKSTTINNARAKEATRTLPNGVGKYSREMDTALPGKHTRTLYDTLKRREASVLAQLRTGIPPPDWRSNRIGSMRMRPSKGNCQAFPLPMREMGCIPNTNASTDRHKTRQPLLLFEGGSTI